ncbi:cold-shock protein [Aeromicrobium sp.]|uniref:cold-shock protein n=1 Tax=Aeromicrobium sp. TaxID=1871063 RepID=UPI00199AD8E1|nr:cold shock domain-containing protein [Aeromicrobium sp.]MBC7631031.1 cold shock domain-containing protein [Aeromicrobium sp.]
MTSLGQVRVWNIEDGWGVIDSVATPGGCWAHYSAVLVAGHRSLHAGQLVRFSFETVEQDGYAFRAVEAWPAEQTPVRMNHIDSGPTSAYRSTLTLTFDDEGRSG